MLMSIDAILKENPITVPVNCFSTETIIQMIEDDSVSLMQSEVELQKNLVELHFLCTAHDTLVKLEADIDSPDFNKSYMTFMRAMGEDIDPSSNDIEGEVVGKTTEEKKGKLSETLSKVKEAIIKLFDKIRAGWLKFYAEYASKAGRLNKLAEQLLEKLNTTESFDTSKEVKMEDELGDTPQFAATNIKQLLKSYNYELFDKLGFAMLETASSMFADGDTPDSVMKAVVGKAEIVLNTIASKDLLFHSVVINVNNEKTPITTTSRTNVKVIVKKGFPEEDIAGVEELLHTSIDVINMRLNYIKTLNKNLPLYQTMKQKLEGSSNLGESIMYRLIAYITNQLIKSMNNNWDRIITSGLKTSAAYIATAKPNPKRANPADFENFDGKSLPAPK